MMNYFTAEDAERDGETGSTSCKRTNEKNQIIVYVVFLFLNSSVSFAVSMFFLFFRLIFDINPNEPTLQADCTKRH
jgi:hypothetical protein